MVWPGYKHYALIEFRFYNEYSNPCSFRGLWDVKRKPRPVAHAPPIDVFPAYDGQPGPRADDYIADSDYPAEAYY